MTTAIRVTMAALVFAVACVLGVPCAGSAARDEAPAVAGTVTLESTGTPVEGAVVYSLAVQEIARTDEHGRYAFKKLAEGVHTIIALAPGLATREPTVATVEAGKTLSIDFVLGPCGTLSGTVVDGVEGTPIAGAKVVVKLKHDGLARYEYGRRCSPFDWFDPDLPLHTQTDDDDGAFTIPLRIAAMSELAVYFPDYKEVWLDLGKVDGDDPLRIELSHGCVVSGRVVDPDGQPLEGAIVCVRCCFFDQAMPESWEWPPGADGDLTNKEGRFVLGGLPAGTYYLGVYHDEYAFAIAAPITLAADEGADDVLLQLEVGATISGRVTDENGRPWKNAWVVCRKTDMEGDPLADEAELEESAGRYKTWTGDDGTFTLRLLPSGDYEVTAQGGGILSPARKIHVESGATVKGVSLTLGAPQRGAGEDE